MQKQKILVSPEDSDLMEKRWAIIKGCNTYYAHRQERRNGKIILVKLHRAIMERVVKRKLRRFEFIDHINFNGIDNRRENLRVVTPQENSIRQRRPSELRLFSKYRGVTKVYNSPGIFRARIQVKRKTIHIGCYITEKEAAKAYDDAAKKYFGDFAMLNFPEE